MIDYHIALVTYWKYLFVAYSPKLLNWSALFYLWQLIWFAVWHSYFVYVHAHNAWISVSIFLCISHQWSWLLTWCWGSGGSCRVPEPWWHQEGGVPRNQQWIYCPRQDQEEAQTWGSPPHLCWPAKHPPWGGSWDWRAIHSLFSYILADHYPVFCNLYVVVAVMGPWR